MTAILYDLRFSWRVLRRSPGFAAVAVLSMGLGIGANTAIFSLMNSFVFQLLPAPDPQQLVFVERTGERGGADTDFPYEAYEQIRDRNRTLAESFAFDDTNISVTIDGQAEMATAEFGSGSMFPMLGGRALLGRAYSTSDDRAGAPQVLVISYSFWNRRFARDRAVLGEKVLSSGCRLPSSVLWRPIFWAATTLGLLRICGFR
jgi:hypothetical protein